MNTLKSQYLKLKEKARNNSTGVSQSKGRVLLHDPSSYSRVMNGTFFVEMGMNTANAQNYMRNALGGKNPPRNALIFQPRNNKNSTYFISTKTWNTELIKNGKLRNNKYRVNSRASWMNIN